MKVYRGKPIALPTIEEVEGELYVAVNKEDLSSTEKYYLRQHFATVEDGKIKTDYNDYLVDKTTLQEVEDEFERE